MTTPTGHEAIARGTFATCLDSFKDDEFVKSVATMIPANVLKNLYNINDPRNLTRAQIELIRNKMFLGAMVGKERIEKEVVNQLKKPQETSVAIDRGLEQFANAVGICSNPKCDKKALEESYRTKTDLKLAACAACHIPKYCSKNCQRSHWPEHKPVCLLSRNKN